MLQSINGTIKNWIIIPLFTLLILSFVVWGIADVFTNQAPQKVVITAGDVTFDAQQVQADVQRNLDYLRRVTGAAITSEMADQLGIIDRSIDNLVTRALMDQESKRLGIAISDKLILQAIRNIPEFKKEDGAFDAEKFRAALSRVGVSETMFMAEQRVALAREKIQDVVSLGTMPSALLQKALVAAEGEKRTFETYQIKYAAQPAATKPADADLEKYVQDNASRFSTPETRSISVLRLTPTLIAKTISISDEQVKAYYDAHADEFTAPELRTFEQVVVPTKEEAETISKNFAAAKNITTLSDMKQADLPTELQQPAFALAQGAVSAPVQSDLGWHVLRLVKATAAKTTAFAEAQKTIRANLQTDAANERLYDESARLDDLLAAGTSLEEIAKELDVAVEKFENLSGDSTVPAALEKQKAVLQEAFKLTAGTQSNVISMGEDGYAVVRVDNVTAAAVKPFAAVKAEALAAWQREQQERTAQEKSIKLLADLRNNVAFETAATTYRAEATREAAVTQESVSAINYIPANATADLFKMKQGDVTQLPTDDAIVVVRFVSATLPVTVADAKPNGVAGKQLAETLQKEMLETYINGLKQRYPVSIDKPTIRKMFETTEEE